MARPLRVNIEDSWYHACARGLNRMSLYDVDRDRRHYAAAAMSIRRFDARLHKDRTLRRELKEIALKLNAQMSPL